MPCLVSLTGKDSDFQSLSWALGLPNDKMIGGSFVFVDLPSCAT
jgi:hypothetical protein